MTLKEQYEKSIKTSYIIENDFIYERTIKKVYKPAGSDRLIFAVDKKPLLNKEVFIKCYNEWIK